MTYAIKSIGLAGPHEGTFQGSDYAARTRSEHVADVPLDGRRILALVEEGLGGVDAREPLTSEGRELTAL